MIETMIAYLTAAINRLAAALDTKPAEQNRNITQLPGTQAQPSSYATSTPYGQPMTQPVTQPPVANQISAHGQPMAQQQALPSAPPSHTLDELRHACIALVDKDPHANSSVVALIKSYGIDSIDRLPTDKFNEFATRVRQLGGMI